MKTCSSLSHVCAHIVVSASELESSQVFVLTCVHAPAASTHTEVTHKPLCTPSICLAVSLFLPDEFTDILIPCFLIVLLFPVFHTFTSRLLLTHSDH